MAPMKILVRIPNWLGDIVMASQFVDRVAQIYPGSTTDVIVKDEYGEITRLAPSISHIYPFDRNRYRGLWGPYRFGREIARRQRYDIFFCLPTSFSSAVIGYATGARRRVGYRYELRSFLLTDNYPLPTRVHRVQKFNLLLSRFSGREIPPPEAISFNRPPTRPETVDPVLSAPYIVAAFNSEAQSRTLPQDKSAGLLRDLAAGFAETLVVTGKPTDRERLTSAIGQIPERDRILNLAGITTLDQLVVLLAWARVVVTTDSGPAHLGNAMGAPTVVLMGAGDERETAPYNGARRRLIRVPGLDCAPCVKNTCRFGTPPCLTRLDNDEILAAVESLLDET